MAKRFGRSQRRKMRQQIAETLGSKSALRPRQGRLFDEPQPKSVQQEIGL